MADQKPKEPQDKKPKPHKFWRAKGRAAHDAPSWVKTRASLTSAAFPPYYRQTPDIFAQEVGSAIAQLNLLKSVEGGPPNLGHEDGILPDYGEVNQAVMQEDSKPLQQVVNETVELFNGVSNVNHPFFMPNVLPAPNKASIIAYTMAAVGQANVIEGEYAWNVEKAEMESAAMIADLIGWNTEEAAGFYTYGGSGCYLYAMKYALTQVFGEQSRCTGIRTDGKILVSQQGHYAKMNATDWLGIGMDNIVDINTDDDTNAMDLTHLREKMHEFYNADIPIIAVVCTMGTTDALAIDDAYGVRQLIEEFPNKAPYGKPFLYCDSVIGWSFLTFSRYDFENNPLNFSSGEDGVLSNLQTNAGLMETIKYSDAMGVDFHKSGWAPYCSSMFLMKDYNEYRSWATRPGSAYLHARTPYNPGLYMLEVSRSASGVLAGWASLQYLGLKGFQSIIGGVLEVERYFRLALKDVESMVCVNEENYGYVTLIRVYETGVNAEDQYAKEVSQEEYIEDLKHNNSLQEKIANIMWYQLRTASEDNGNWGAFTNYTSGFRTTDYNDDMGDPDAVIYAVKAYPMNVNVTFDTMDELIVMLGRARDLAVSGYEPPLPEPGQPEYDDNICKPYSELIGSTPCNSEQEPGRIKINDMISGISIGKKKKRSGK